MDIYLHISQSLMYDRLICTMVIKGHTDSNSDRAEHTPLLHPLEVIIPLLN